ncbi:MAG: ribonuclease H-like domain-containing protein [Ignavibacteriae bacterium]|nr:ribonuclease H-like domain-containing protein [Ignavibacteriota bacterium]
MTRVVFDIETIALPFDSFDAVQQEYLVKNSTNDEEREAEIEKLSIYPLTAQVLAIGMLNPDTKAGKVFYQANEKEQFLSEDGKIEYVSGDEREILSSFWETIAKYDQFITFNGRSFDCPFIMLRTGILGIAPTRNLNPYRYDTKIHCDLLEQLTFYNATRKFNLDFYCKSFGIKSPKSEGFSGGDVGKLFQEGRYREIALYCAGDVQATAELFHRWNEFLNV